MKIKKISKKTAKKMVDTLNRQVARENKAFEKMTPAQKRVAIARDVLSQMTIKRLVPKAGYWLNGKNGAGLFTKKDIKQNPELKDLLKKTKQCEGCALGGMFMCAVERADKLKLGELDGVQGYNAAVQNAKERGENPNSVSLKEDADDTIAEDDAFSYLSKFFSYDQLVLIESCFEANQGAHQSDEAYGFAEEEEDPSERMRLVMENIIVNKGTFRPTNTPLVRYYTPGFTG